MAVDRNIVCFIYSTDVYLCANCLDEEGDGTFKVQINYKFKVDKYILYFICFLNVIYLPSYLMLTTFVWTKR